MGHEQRVRSLTIMTAFVRRVMLAISFSTIVLVFYYGGMCYVHPGSRPIPARSRRLSCCEEAAQQKLEVLCSPHVEPTDGARNCSCVDYMMCKLVFVTALSSNHYKESLDYFGSVHLNMPNTTIIVYDIGRTEGRRGKDS